ncbi:glycosyltransferase family A protein [Planktothrix sp.]|uniref:glycosyltransferase family A protein n=2 Tax=Planktothrix sp. TaxID=3088171 RepID=UPI0038D4559F
MKKNIVNHQKISIVFAGRNDQYGGDFKSKLLAAWKRNYTEMITRGIEGEWIFIEWNPLNEDYLSYTLAPLGFKCYVVPASIHQSICTNPDMNFMQFYAKNVGIRKASYPWVLLTNADVVFGNDVLDYLQNNTLLENIIYRAERRDIKSGLYTADFPKMLENTVMYYDSYGGQHFERGAGDFTLYNKNRIDFGHDENIKDSDIYIDIRFISNYLKKHESNSNISPGFKFIGTVFKEDHQLTWRNTSHLASSHKGLNKREEYLTQNIPYHLPENWGLIDYPVKKLDDNIGLLQPFPKTVNIQLDHQPIIPQLSSSNSLLISASPKSLKIVALLTIRNEERYLSRCLEHLRSQGIEVCVIDNDSTDQSLEIAKSFLGRGVIRIENFPYEGKFELTKICQNEERLALEINADWFIHHDADEIRQAPPPYPTLLEGIEDTDRQGYNAINFDEFVFLPTSEAESYEGKDYVQEMQYYYFFEPDPLRRINAWKKTPHINIHSSGGHHALFPERKIFPIPFILRHYIILSKDHVIEKYIKRVHCESELAKGWMLDRARFTPDKLNFPSKSELKKLDPSGIWDRTEPWDKHHFLLGKKETSSQPLSKLQRLEKGLARSQAWLEQIQANLKE